MGAHHKRNKHELHVGGIVYFLVIYSYFIITRASKVKLTVDTFRSHVNSKRAELAMSWCTRLEPMNHGSVQ